MPKPFTPSSWHLEQQVAAAMQRCDGDIDQARRAKEAADDRRMERILLAKAEATGRRMRWGF